MGQPAELKDQLEAAGIKVNSAQPGELRRDINSTDVLWLNQSSLDRDPDLIITIRHWVMAGGGLIITGPAWGWQSLHPTKALDKDHSGNQLVNADGNCVCWRHSIGE